MQPQVFDFKCQRCGECCKRYYIISLPHEVEKQATFKGLPREEFIEKHMQLFLQLFPAEHSEGKIQVSSSLVPKKFLGKIEGELSGLPDFFIALPLLVFKRREGGECTFYDSNSGCTIYPARPAECRLFPFISDKKAQNYAELYPFCHGLKARDDKASYLDLSFIHFRQVAEYFGTVKEKGFGAVWKKWPQEGICLFKDKLLGPINEQEFFQAIAPYK